MSGPHIESIGTVTRDAIPVKSFGLALYQGEHGDPIKVAIALGIDDNVAALAVRLSPDTADEFAAMIQRAAAAARCLPVH